MVGVGPGVGAGGAASGPASDVVRVNTIDAATTPSRRRHDAASEYFSKVVKLYGQERLKPAVEKITKSWVYPAFPQNKKGFNIID